MRPEEFVIGLERLGHERGLLEEREEEFEEGDAKPYDEQVAENRISDRSHHDDVLGVMKAIFEQRSESIPQLDELQLSVQEKSALQALQTAYTGRETRYNTFVFAEQRRELLEQALSALQPMLALDVSASSEMRETYERMVEQVTQLRVDLLNLEDSQDDEMLVREQLKREEQEAADADKNDGDSDAEATERGEKKSALFDGPEAPQKVPAKSSLSDGPEAPDYAAGKSSLSDGPAAPERAAAKSSLVDETSNDAAGGGGEAGAGGGKGGVLGRIGRALGIGKGEPGGGKS